MSQSELSDKPFAIPKQAVVEAFRKVKANQGGPGVDGCTIEEYESDLARFLDAQRMHDQRMHEMIR